MFSVLKFFHHAQSTSASRQSQAAKLSSDTLAVLDRFTNEAEWLPVKVTPESCHPTEGSLLILQENCSGSKSSLQSYWDWVAEGKWNRNFWNHLKSHSSLWVLVKICLHWNQEELSATKSKGRWLNKKIYMPVNLLFLPVKRFSSAKRSLWTW